jgi:hypothetical protein
MTARNPIQSTRQVCKVLGEDRPGREDPEPGAWSRAGGTTRNPPRTHAHLLGLPFVRVSKMTMYLAICHQKSFSFFPSRPSVCQLWVSLSICHQSAETQNVRGVRCADVLVTTNDDLARMSVSPAHRLPLLSSSTRSSQYNLARPLQQWRSCCNLQFS